MPLPARAPLALAAALALAALAGCGPDAPADEEGPAADSAAVAAPANTVLTAARQAGLSTFETTVVQAGLVERLNGEGPFTVFAPTNAAFARLGGAALDTLLADTNRERLARILRYHVVPGRLESTGVDGTMTFQTAHGGALTVERTAEGLFVSDGAGARARVVTPDLNRGNGVLHVIDAVLTPPPPGDTTGVAPGTAPGATPGAAPGAPARPGAAPAPAARPTPPAR